MVAPATVSGDASSDLDEDGPGGDIGATVTCRSVSGDIRLRLAAEAVTG